MKRSVATLLASFLLLIAFAAPANADIVLLLGESYGKFGSFSPTGHVAVYLTNVCAESAIELRPCRLGEMGTVISRYHRVGGYDWVAMPLMPYLYGVERAEEVPASADRARVLAIRDGYRRTHLADLVPDGANGQPPKGDWVQLVGAAYDRSITAFALNTDPQQDRDIIQFLNGAPNAKRFNLLLRNCADFARDLIHLYFPKALRSNVIADLGLTTPKQVAKSVVRFASSRPDLQLRGFVIPQIPGSRKHSRHAKGVLESLVKTKKYAVPLIVAQPWVPAGFAAGYLVSGRFNPERHVTEAYEPQRMEALGRDAVAIAVSR